jgi:hypothetical protein
MTEDIEDWMRGNDVRRIVRIGDKGWGVYLTNLEPFGTGETLAQALADAEARV